MDRLVFALLLLAVPLQYFILGFSMPKFLTDVTSMILPPIDMDAWLPSWIGLVAWLTEAFFSVDSVTFGEVLLYSPRDSDGNVQLNNERPEGLKFKVGEVVQHKTEGTRGVIISWGVERSESDEEFAVIYMYTVLLDTPEDNLSAAAAEYEESLTAQFFQHEVQKISGYMTSSTDLHIYFHMFDGEKFWPKGWLRKVFPNG